MSHKGHSGIAGKRRAHAPVFAALGDETRLSLVAGPYYRLTAPPAGSDLERAGHRLFSFSHSARICSRSARDTVGAGSPSITSRTSRWWRDSTQKSEM